MVSPPWPGLPPHRSKCVESRAVRACRKTRRCWRGDLISTSSPRALSHFPFCLPSTLSILCYFIFSFLFPPLGSLPPSAQRVLYLEPVIIFSLLHASSFLFSFYSNPSVFPTDLAFSSPDWLSVSLADRSFDYPLPHNHIFTIFQQYIFTITVYKPTFYVFSLHQSLFTLPLWLQKAMHSQIPELSLNMDSIAKIRAV